MIPKHPVAVSKAKKKLPLEIDWGNGIPKDRLRYINAREEALIKLHRSTTAERTSGGIKAYPDPGDTAAGDKNNSRGADGPGGVGRGSGSGSGSASTSSTSKSSSTSASAGAGTGSKTAETKSTPAPAATPTSKAPNAAAQAASDKLNSKAAAPSAKTNASTGSAGASKAPNAAAQAASDKLNASQAPKAAAQSIQGMINSQAASLHAPNGSYYGPKGGSSLNSAALNAASRSAQTAPNGSYYGPKGTGALNADARMAAARSVGFNPSPVTRTPNDARDLGRMMVAESANIDNRFGKDSIPGYLGVGEVVRNRMLSSQYPNTVQGVLGQRKQFSPIGDGSFARTPENPMATRIADSILSGESPPTVGTSLNYGNLNTINNKPGYSSPATRSAFNSMRPEARIADAQNPNAFSHTFGTIGKSDVAFNSGGPTGLGSVGLAAAAGPSIQERMASFDPPAATPQGIPSPQGMLGNSFAPPAAPMRDPAAARALGLQQTPPVAQQRDPAAAMASGLQQTPAPEEVQAPTGYFSQFAMTPDDINRMKSQAMKDFGFGQLMEMNKNIGALPAFMGPITRDQEAVKRQQQQMASAPPPQAPAAPMSPTPNMRPPSQNMQTPPGWGQERVLGVENYTDLNSQRDPAAARMAGLQQSPLAQTMVAGDPRAGMPPGAFPATPQAIRDPAAARAPGLTQSPSGMTAGLPSALPGFSPRIASDPRVGMPTGGFPAAPQEATSFSPEVGPGDAVPEDGSIYSDSPIQGPTNPIQEGFPVEDPKLQRDRQIKYAERGAAIGGIIAGPLGTVVGATLGYQMGKTNPAQRQAIASNPQALNANVQSINQMVEERGGKGSPQMRVTNRGMRAVLTQPQAVLEDPQQFTTLEQMLAQLALGNDPNSGKPI